MYMFNSASCSVKSAWSDATAGPPRLREENTTLREEAKALRAEARAAREDVPRGLRRGLLTSAGRSSIVSGAFAEFFGVREEVPGSVERTSHAVFRVLLRSLQGRKSRDPRRTQNAALPSAVM